MIPLHIENIAFGGEGVGRTEGLVVFTPFTLPEEDILVSVLEKKKNFAKGRLERILHPSPHRVLARCPYFTFCGGCQLQHASYEKQLEYKRQFVEDALRRIGKISFPVPPLIASSSPFSYRRHLSMQLALLSEGWRLCFSSSTYKPFGPSSCLLFHAEEDPILTSLQKRFSTLSSTFPLKGRAKLLKTQSGYAMGLSLDEELSSCQIEELSSVLQDLLVGLWIETRGKRLTLKPCSLSFSCLGLQLTYSPFCFLQNHEEQSEKIYALLPALLKKSQHVLDLYCGIGISSLVLAREGKKVIALELSEESIELGKQNSKNNNLFPQEFIAAPAEAEIERLLESFRPDAIVVNPPKTGLCEKVKRALGQAASLQEIVYVSCHPPTLARDLAFLREKGFALTYLQSFDCFPQTTHVETVVHLTRQNHI